MPPLPAPPIASAASAVAAAPANATANGIPAITNGVAAPVLAAPPEAATPAAPANGIAEAAASGPRPSIAAEELRTLVAHAKQTLATLQAAIDAIEQRVGPTVIAAAPPSEPSSSRTPSRPSWLASVAKKVRSSLPS